ncbi:MAG: zinc-finger domain-containing protein [Betaproteobacteria bacterium]|jgi:uncharacterized Zn-finger protein|nr:zinc-finger domain-containing protein [Betaproteobacteria bacterium]
MADTVQKEPVIEVGERDLPLHCPTARTPVWCYHPRVFLDVAQAGEARCPYCGTLYVYKGPPLGGH